jgi:sulfur relay protein TusB/DsrH
LLIILSKSTTTRTNGSILEIAGKLREKGENTAIMHIQDACIATTMNEYCEKLARRKITLYSLKADLKARGLLERVNPHVRIVDYKQWIDFLMNEHSKIVSWTS